MNLTNENNRGSKNSPCKVWRFEQKTHPCIICCGMSLTKYVLLGSSLKGVHCSTCVDLSAVSSAWSMIQKYQ